MTFFDPSAHGRFLTSGPSSPAREHLRARLAKAGQEKPAAGFFLFDPLEGRKDIAELWDIRVSSEARQGGVGKALFSAAAEWAKERGCRLLKIETQNVNVAACRFYAAMGCELGLVNRFAYQPPDAGEVQFAWYLRLE